MYFTEEHEMFRQTVRRFVEEEINPYVDEWEAEGIFPAHKLFKKMGDLGFLGLNYPEEYGGADADYWYTVVFAEELAQAHCGGVPMGIVVHTDICTPALALYGSHELKKMFLEPACKGDIVGAVGVSEPDAGSDVASIRTRAEKDGEDYVITGTKLYITNGTQADFICLLAHTSDGPSYRGMSLIIVPTNLSGFSVGRKVRKLGNHSSDTGELVFDHVRVPQWYRIGREGQGFVLQMQQFQKERLISSIMAHGTCERTVRDTIAYTKQRIAFGHPLIHNQWIQFKLAELLTEIEALRQLNYHCVRMLLEGQDFTLEASMAKLKAGRLTREVNDTCLQFYGGMGYLEEAPISRRFRDGRALSIVGGADEIMLDIIAKYEDFLT